MTSEGRASVMNAWMVTPNGSARNSATGTPLYDPFLFVDSLTNRSIPVRNIRDKTRLVRTHRHSKTQEIGSIGSQTESKQLDQCIDFLKETMTFRKNALREKLFGDIRKEGETPSQGLDLVRKKRLIRQVVSQEIQNKNRNELDKYLHEPGHTLDQNLLKATRSSNFLLSKKAISKLVGSLEKKQGHPLQTIHRREESEDPFLDRMDSIQSEMKSEIREKLRKSGQFLVEPQYHFVQARSFTPGRFQQHFQSTSDQRRAFLKELQWQPTTSQSKLKTRKQPHIPIRGKHDNEIIYLVASGDVEDVQIFAQKHRKDCLRAHDLKGNSLLHIAVMSNKVLTFEWLLRVLGVSGLLQKNEEGVTAAELAVRLNRREILSYIPHSML